MPLNRRNRLGSGGGCGEDVLVTTCVMYDVWVRLIPVESLTMMNARGENVVDVAESS